MRLRGRGIIRSSIEGQIPHVNPDVIARLALAMYDHRYFFSVRRDVSIRFSRDLNGSGVQGLYIERKGEPTGVSNLITIIFEPMNGAGGDFLYEADLIRDQRKDYEPTVNKGKHRFVARSANMDIEWDSEEASQWRLDIDRLSRSPNSLGEWIEADLEMLVTCSPLFFICDHRAILSKDDLMPHLAAGLGLDDLKTRLKCSKCGKRGASVGVF